MLEFYLLLLAVEVTNLDFKKFGPNNFLVNILKENGGK